MDGDVIVAIGNDEIVKCGDLCDEYSQLSRGYNDIKKEMKGREKEIRELTHHE